MGYTYKYLAIGELYGSVKLGVAYRVGQAVNL